MNGWVRVWWGAAALAVMAEAALLRLDLWQVAPEQPLGAGTPGDTGAWFGRDVQGYDSLGRLVYGLPQAWSLLGFVLVAVAVALWRESRVALTAAAPAMVTALLPTHHLAVSAALVATSILAVAATRSAPSRFLQVASGSVGVALLLLVVAGAGRASSGVEKGSTADLVRTAAVPGLLVVALILTAVAVVPRPRSSTTDEPVEVRVRAGAWTVVAVAGAVQLAVAAASLIDRLPDLAAYRSAGNVQTVTVAIANFTGAEPPRVDLLSTLSVVATLSAAAAAIAALLLRGVHPVVIGAVGCFVLAVLPVGAAAQTSLALAGFAILAFVALRTSRRDVG